MPPIKRPLISKYPSNNVGASSFDADIIGADPIPEGKQFRITCFGGAMPGAGRIELQLRTRKASTNPTVTEKWRTVRGIIGPGHAHYENLQPIEGDSDGIAALRIVRTNDETTAQKINAWVEGIRR
jgi:hypothetical protein